MRFSHPFVWVMLVAFAVIGVGAIVVVTGITAALTRFRSARWPGEREARAAWHRCHWRVEAATRVTDAGDVSLSLVLDEPPMSYRARSMQRRVKKIVRFAPDVASVLQSVQSLPMRIHPTRPLVLALDFELLFGEGGEIDGDAMARDDFVRNGRVTWAPRP